MAEVNEKFLYDDGVLETVSSAAWTSYKTGPATGTCTVLSRRATNTTLGEVSYANYVATYPTGTDQEVAAWVTSSEEAADASVRIGVAKVSGTAIDVLGVFATLTWAAGGVRTISIKHRFYGEASETTDASLTLVAAGTVEVDGYDGALVGKGALNELQLLRLVVTSEPYGQMARVFLNNLDDDDPVLWSKIDSDFMSPTDSSTDWGAWWFGFGSTTSDHALKVAQFYGADYDVSDDIETQEIREDQVSLAELRKRVRLRYEKSSNSQNIDSERIDAAIRDEVEQTLNSCGDAAWFMIREESMALTPDSNGWVTLDVKVKRLLGLKDTAYYDVNVGFHFSHLTTNGANVVQLQASSPSTYKVKYLLRHTQMFAEDDICPIPREHTEVVVSGVCVRLAEGDRQQASMSFFLARYRELSALLKRDQNRFGDQAKSTMVPRRRGIIYKRGSRGRSWS